MKLHRKLKINWWLWACLSAPSVAYSLLRPHEDKAGQANSDFDRLVYYFTHDLWGYSREVLVWDVALPLILGWIGQYFLVMAWDAWSSKRPIHALVK